MIVLSLYQLEAPKGTIFRLSTDHQCTEPPPPATPQFSVYLVIGVDSGSQESIDNLFRKGLHVPPGQTAAVLVNSILGNRLVTMAGQATLGTTFLNDNSDQRYSEHISGVFMFQGNDSSTVAAYLALALGQSISWERYTFVSTLYC